MVSASAIRLIGALSLLPAFLDAQSQDDLRALRDVVSSQEAEMRAQRDEIDKLRQKLDEQRRLLQQAMGIAVPPASTKPLESASAPRPPGPEATPNSAPRPLPKSEESRNLSLNASQEVRFSNASPTLKLGPANVRLEGYIALAGLYDTANTGGSIGTNFAAIPYPDTPEGNSSEFRLSSQRTRVAVRVDTKTKRANLGAYLEADFRGTVAGNVAVTSSSFGFRVRQAWIDYQRNKWQVSAGQMFSLITPVRTAVTPDPYESMMSYAVDAQYLAGLVWDRAPGVRIAYRPTSDTTFAAALENPEQQVGTAVRFPSALAPVLNTQYNTGTAELRTPNTAPDALFKGSFNFGPDNHRVHLDSGVVLRFFRNYNPAMISGHKNATGIGGNVNLGIDLTRRIHLVLNGFVSSGGGRYIGGLAPDVVVRTDGSISPLKAHSWVTGLEFFPNKRTNISGYYSGVYLDRNVVVDQNGSLVGFGFEGSNAARRSIQQWTGTWGHLLWASESSGSLQWNSQYSYIQNYPWAASTGPRQGTAHLVFGQIRYNLP